MRSGFCFWPYLLFLTACRSPSLTFPIPEQRTLPPRIDPPPIGSFLDFGQEDGLDYIVRDIDAGGEARWTRDHPELKFRVDTKAPVRLVLDFIVVEETFRTTGPLTLQVKVNDHPLESMRCARPGEYHFEQSVPPDWITHDGPTRVIAEAAPVWVAPADGAHLAYLLLRAGFRW